MQHFSGTIPIRISVTGHRHIQKDCIPELYRAVKETLTQIQNQAPDSEIILATNMAEGADQICSLVARELSIPYVAVLPFAEKEYEKDFEGQALETFREILKGAQQVFSVCTEEQAHIDRDACYKEAGEYLADHCHLLLALKNEDPAKPTGCGAAEIAAYTTGNDIPVLTLHTPRTDENIDGAGNVVSYFKEEEFKLTLKQTDQYNKKCKKLDQSEDEDLLPDCSKRTHTILETYLSANELSNMYSKKFRMALLSLAFVGLLFLLSFLLYDELEAHFLIFFCGAFLLLSFLILKGVEKRCIHKNYISYRVLAECLRVQGFLLYAGSSIEVTEILLWTQKYEYPWIVSATSVLTFGEENEKPHDIRTFWLENQRDYHRGVLANNKKIKKATLILHGSLSLSILAYLFALFMELFFAARMLPETADTFRTVVKIAVGMFSAATLFAVNYYGKLSLGRRKEDSQKMAEFFDEALRRAKTEKQDEDFLLYIAREELSENGTWYSYMKDNVPDIGI